MGNAQLRELRPNRTRDAHSSRILALMQPGMMQPAPTPTPVKKRPTPLWVPIGIVALVAVAVAAFIYAVVSPKGDRSSATETRATDAQVGQPLPMVWPDGGEATVTLNSMTWAPAGDSGPGQARNGAYLIIDVTYEARVGEVSYRSSNWTFKDDQGHEYFDSLFGHTGPELRSGSLRAGDKVRGQVSFDAPRVKGAVRYANTARWPVQP